MGRRSGCAPEAALKILVDTPVWIDFFSGCKSVHAELLSDYIRQAEEIATCGLIMTELFQGLSDTQAMRKLIPYFLEMIYLAPRVPETYLEAANLFRQLRKRKIRVRTVVDCIIACIAVENDFTILSKDRDFALIRDSGLCSVRLAPLPDPGR